MTDTAPAIRRHDDLLIIGGKMPLPGLAKTRLGATLSDAVAASLYRAFVADVADRFGRAALDLGYDLAWGFTPADADFGALIAELAPGAPPPAHFIPQVGPDWGVRQVNLLRWGAEAGYARTVLIASDSPQLTIDQVIPAFSRLHAVDVALARVHDGGYYLIGCRGFHDVITGAPMSTARAADALVARAGELGLSLAELEPSFDVDVVEDLTALVDALGPDGRAAPATWAALDRLKLRDRYPV
ncbi:MAG TPA: DUF2064 domain-containing protein [Thermomicrobiales bacterium]|nr:DUF2064 domain-containing protein [Thermomicrobiales bacterium]